MKVGIIRCQQTEDMCPGRWQYGNDQNCRTCHARLRQGITADLRTRQKWHSEAGWGDHLHIPYVPALLSFGTASIRACIAERNHLVLFHMCRESE